jgi:hypothetical protein
MANDLCSEELTTAQRNRALVAATRGAIRIPYVFELGMHGAHS